IHTAFIFFLFLMNFQQIMSQSEAKLTWSVQMPEPYTHYFTVKLIIENNHADSLKVQMPVWTPGSYLVREYAKNVENFQVKNSQGKVLSFKKYNKNSWQIAANGSEKIEISYQSYAYELSVRTCFLSDEYAYINGAGLFLYLADQPSKGGTLLVEAAPQFKKLSTALSHKQKGNSWEIAVPDFDTLVDSPILVGNQELMDFKAAGVPHQLAIVGGGNYDSARMVSNIQRIVEVETKLFGSNPCNHYLFIVLNTESSYGGLEHLFSTSLIYPRWRYKPDGTYMKFLGLAAHEYFHLWNVKRIRPIELGPFDYSNENYTDLLWQVEGFTSYYDDYFLRRAGLMSEDAYLAVLAENIAYALNTPGSLVEPLADASFDTWIKFYRKNENSVNANVSYYVKGAAVAFMLDALIRANSEGKNSLDDVLRHLYQHYYQELGRGFTDAELKTTLEKFTQTNLDQFYADYIYGTKALDYPKYLSMLGLAVEAETMDPDKVYFGVNTKNEGDNIIVTEVFKDSPAWKAGINVNDELIAVNDYRFKSNLSEMLQNFAQNETVNVLVSRDGILQNIKVTLGSNPRVKLKIFPDQNATSAQKAYFQDWIKAVD
ncbi:MAG: M61 family metallopeptidase, partial [Bacteroidetes bacterium]|nr:M61 family metallopeptidase [Bacteroidota bacterium]